MTQLSALTKGLTLEFFTTPDENLGDLVGRFFDERTFGAIVLDEARRVVGVITEHDIVREAYFKSACLHDSSVGTAMTKDVISCNASTELDEALRLMGKHDIRHLVVKDGDDVVGFVSVKDILQKVHADDQLEISVLRDLAGGHQISSVS